MSPSIVIIEDDPIQQKIYQLLCHRFHFDSIVFSSAGAACDYLRTAPALPQVLLLDCILNGENGLDSVPQLKEIARNRGGQLPIVAVTANAFDAHKAECLAAGVDDYLSKPFSVEQFLEMAQRWGAISRQSGVA